MDINKNADRIAMMDRFIDTLKEKMPSYGYKMMVDRDTIQALYQNDPPSFFEFGNGEMRYRDIVVERNDNVSGIWVQFH